MISSHYKRQPPCPKISLITSPPAQAGGVRLSIHYVAPRAHCAVTVKPFLPSGKIVLENTALGLNALFSNTTGSRNIGLGAGAGGALTTGDDNIDIGTSGVAGESATIRIGTIGAHRNTYVAGIYGVTVARSAAPVFVDSSGHLGTRTSAARFKDQIKPMDRVSEAILIDAPKRIYCYDVFADDRLMIHQTSVPALPGNEGFRTKQDATKVALLVIEKIKKGEIPPTISIADGSRATCPRVVVNNP